MKDTLFIPVILGTARKDRNSARVAHYVVDQVSRAGHDTELIDVRDWVWGPETIAAWIEDERAHPWREKAQKADAFIVVSPEYNHGYPGELKILLDAAHEEYKGKPVAVAGVSTGTFGGARVVDHIKPVFVEMLMVPIREAIHVSKAADAFDEDGKPNNEGLAKATQGTIEELVQYARALKGAVSDN